MPILPPEAVAELLRARSAHLSEQIDSLRTEMAEARRNGLEGLFLVEDEYELTMALAERRFVQRLIERMTSGELGGMEFWRRFHAARSTSDQSAKP